MTYQGFPKSKTTKARIRKEQKKTFELLKSRGLFSQFATYEDFEKQQEIKKGKQKQLV